MKKIQTTTALFLATTLTMSGAFAFNVNNINPGYEAVAAQAENRSVAPNKAVIKGTTKKLNEVQQVTAPDAELKATFDMMTQEIVRVQAVYDSGQYGQALNESKKLLDTVRMRTGIHPKAKITEKIEIKNVFEDGESVSSFNSLSQEKREAIALAVLNHRGGLYLDILNQTKRASLIYIKSLYMRLKKDGPLLSEDIQKIKTDLLAIMAYKIDLIQYDQDIRFSVKDSDVVNSDQNYLFNREIKIFALGNKDLGWTEHSLEQVQAKLDVVQPIFYELTACASLLKNKVANKWSKRRYFTLDSNGLKKFCTYYDKQEIDCSLKLYNGSDERFALLNTIDMCRKSVKPYLDFWQDMILND